MQKIFAVAASLSLLASAAVASSTHKVAAHHRTPASTTAVNLVCPVTGTKIASIAKAAGHSVYKGKTYYFCCAGCKPQFDKNPAKFVK